jgi:uncharacterized protein (DUF983 family)
MRGNICPKCGKEVMPYSRFIREAEPYKVSACVSCNSKLRRSKFVYLYLLIMCTIMAVTSLPLFSFMSAVHVSYWIIWPVAIVWFSCWILLMNYLAWRIIGWVLVED